MRDDDLELVEAFFYSYEAKYSPLEAVKTPETPEQMITGQVADSPGWITWRLYPWTAQEDFFGSIDDRIGLSFPGVYRRFLTTFHTLIVDVGFIRFPAVPIASENTQLSELVFSAEGRDAVKRGLLPFAWDGRGDLGLLCFEDASRRVDDARICLLRCNEDYAVAPVASSFRRLLKASIYYLRCPVDFMGLGESPLSAEERQQCLREFLSYDPFGMGGEGRAYWQGMAGISL